MTTQQRPPQIGPKDVANGGVINGRSLAKFEDDGANIVSNVYSDPESGKGHNLVIWCLKPGQENSMQWHDAVTHIFIINEGEGVYMKGEPFAADQESPKASSPTPAPGFKHKEVPVKAGDIICIPSNTVHGIKNTGKGNLSYIAVSIGGPYSRIDVGPQVPAHRRPEAPAAH